MAIGTWLQSALAALLLVGMGACRITIEPTIFTADEEFSIDADVSDAASLNVDWEDGAIQVRIDPGAAGIEVTGTKYVTAESVSAAEDAVSEWEIELAIAESAPPQAFLRFNAPSQTARFYRATVEIVVPSGLRLTINSDDAVVDVAGNDRRTSITADNGTVAVTDHAGDVEVDVVHGNVNVDSTDGDVDAIVDSGTITIDARPSAGGSITATVEVGSIGMRTPSNFAADLSLEVNVGVVDADLFDFTVTNLDETLRSTSARLNGGGGTITAEVDLGTVTFGSLP